MPLSLGLGLSPVMDRMAARLLGKVVFDGDSLTYGSGSTGGQTYPAQVMALLAGGFAGGTNLGVSGQAMEQMISDGKTQVDALLSGSLANYLAYWGGTNDFYGSEATASVLRDVARYGVERLAAGWRPVVATLTPNTAALDPPTYESRRQAFNPLVRANYLAFAYDLFDLGADATIGNVANAGNTTYFVDGCHMTNAGYAIVAGLCKAAILRAAAKSAAVIRDRFNRANSSSSAGSAETGQAWAPVNGTFGIASNQAYCTTTNGWQHLLIDAGTANVAITVEVPAIDTGIAGITFRYIDQNNCWVFTGSLFKHVDGVETQVYTAGAAIAPGDVLAVVANGSSLKFYTNGAKVYEGTSTDNQSATKHGIFIYGADVRMDDFSVRALS